MFTVKIRVKPYVKAYLKNNCGDPCDLDHMPSIKEEFLMLFRNPSHRMDNCSINKLNSELNIIISEDNFFRSGWELTQTNMIRFNSIIEKRVKFIMRQFVGVNSSLGIPVSECIRQFQEVFGFTEDEWSFDSIKKDYQRNGMDNRINLIKDFRKELNTNYLAMLSSFGTITADYKQTITENIYG